MNHFRVYCISVCRTNVTQLSSSRVVEYESKFTMNEQLPMHDSVRQPSKAPAMPSIVNIFQNNHIYVIIAVVSVQRPNQHAISSRSSMKCVHVMFRNHNMVVVA